MNDPRLYVCYASSDYYARETGISLIGFLENNPDYKPDMVFILDYGILPPNRKHLDDIASRYGKVIDYIPAKQVLEKIQNSLQIADFRGSLATYSRAFIDMLMPNYVQRLLYIDSDTVVIGSVTKLNTFDMGNACMAGIISEVYSTNIKNGELALYSGNKAYYGCGIVLFDLLQWRALNCNERIIKMLNIKHIYPCADQTLINNSLPESCFCKLPRQYNYNTHIYSSKYELYLLKKGNWNTEIEIQETIINPIIVHYPGRPVDRPWYKGCTSRLKDYYFKYKKLSPWKDDDLYHIPKATSFKQRYYLFIHCLETSNHAFYLLMAINFFRSHLGSILRRFRIINALSPEGIER